MLGSGFRQLPVAIGIAALALGGCGTGAEETAAAPACSPERERYCGAAVGDLVDVTLDQLRPTQPSLGYDEVYYRLGRYTLGAGARDQLLDQWCTTNGQGGFKEAESAATVADPSSFSCSVAVGSETEESRAPMKTVVIGPGGELFLTDGHHTLTSFWEAPGAGPRTPVRLRVTGNLSSSAPDAFWREMQARGWTWLRDADGNPVEPKQLPTNLGLKQFANDPYRGALYFVRDVGYQQDDDSPAFQEFYWGQWLRGQTDPAVQLDAFSLTELPSYLTLVGNIGRAIVALPSGTVIAGDRTAAELGGMKSFGQKAFDALAQPIDSAEPGKLALAIAYKTTR